jgi:hypothetical protein
MDMTSELELSSDQALRLLIVLTIMREVPTEAPNGIVETAAEIEGFVLDGVTPSDDDGEDGFGDGEFAEAA